MFLRFINCIGVLITVFSCASGKNDSIMDSRKSMMFRVSTPSLITRSLNDHFSFRKLQEKKKSSSPATTPATASTQSQAAQKASPDDASPSDEDVVSTVPYVGLTCLVVGVLSIFGFVAYRQKPVLSSTKESTKDEETVAPSLILKVTSDENEMTSDSMTLDEMTLGSSTSDEIASYAVTPESLTPDPLTLFQSQQSATDDFSDDFIYVPPSTPSFRSYTD